MTEPRAGGLWDVMFEVVVRPHDKQRYDTVGDWLDLSKAPDFHATGKRDRVPWRILVSEMPDQRYEILVAVHEMVEAVLCWHHHISQAAVDHFDTTFETERAARLHSEDAEPGDDPRAPYRDAHRFATIVEMMLARELGVDWAQYDKAVSEL